MVELKTAAEVESMAAAALWWPKRCARWSMLIADGYIHDPDGWTLRTASGARAAHSEHTVAVTADGARILTD